MAYIVNPLHPEEIAFYQQMKRERREKDMKQRFVVCYLKVGESKQRQMSDASIIKLRRRLAQIPTTSFTIWGKAEPRRRIIGIKHANASESIFE